MITDPITEAARAEAERRHPAPEIETGDQLGYTQTEIREVVRRTFTNAAEWARAHLAAQEPTDAEVLALIDSLAEQAGVFIMPLTASMALQDSRRAVRRDEEKRDG